MFVFKAAVVGAGVMGGEIAQVIAAADIPVILKDVEQRFVDTGLEKAREVTASQAAKLVEKGKLTQEQARRAGRAHPRQHHRHDRLRRLRRRRLRRSRRCRRRWRSSTQVFAELDAVTPGHAVLASNTSGLSITEIADATQRPDKVVGFHFFWPASFMRLIEVIEGDETSPETVQAATHVRAADPQDADPRGRVPGLRRQPDPRLDRVGDLALPGRDRRCRSSRSTSSSRSRRRCRWARSASPTCRASTRS